MATRGVDYLNDPPTDFEVFVARQRGLAADQAARLIREWMATYESPAGQAPVCRHSSPPSYLP